MFQLYKKENKLLKKIIRKHKCKLGIAFGGGGTRGFAHLGAIKAFEENGIEFDEIAGTSAGSIVATLYAYGLTYEEMYKIAMSLNEDDIRTSKIPLIPSKNEGLQDIIKNSIGDIKFEDIKKSLTVLAVDLYTGKELHIREGSVAKAVAGSCCVPAVFKPVEFENYLLFDGGLQNNIPADVVRNAGSKYVISVDVNSSRGSGTKSTKYIDQIGAALGIAIKANSIKGKLFSDIVIEPDLSAFKNTSVKGREEMIKIGYEKTMEMMPEIKRLLKIKVNKRKFNLFKRNKDKILHDINKESIELNSNKK